MADTTRLRPEARPADGTARRRPVPRPTGTGPTPAGVARAATRRDALPLDRLALIGLFYTPSGATALLRLPGGALARVVAGSLVGDGRVVAILRDGVRLEQGGEEVVLTLPA